MKVCALVVFAVLAALFPPKLQGADIPLVREFQVPSSFFQDSATGNPIDPRERLIAEGITLGEKDSIAYDPLTSLLFVRAKPETLLRLERLLAFVSARSAVQVFLTYRVLETHRPLFADETSTGGDPKSDPDSGTRVVGGERDPFPVESVLKMTRIFTTGEQVDSLVRRVQDGDLGRIRPGATLAARSGQTTETWIGDALTLNVPVISDDASTVEMDIKLFQGRSGAEPELFGETKVAIPSGGSVVFEEKIGETSWRTRIITVVVVDAAGWPIPRMETTALPDDQQRGPSGALFPGPVPQPAIEKVKTIIIPSIEFKETPLLEAIERLNEAGIKHDNSLPESQRGVKIRFVDSGAGEIGQSPVTMRLNNIPLSEAIRYTASLAGCDVRFAGGTVEIGNFRFSGKNPDDGSDIWYAAFLRLREADELERSGKMKEATSKRLQALTLLQVVAVKYPGLQPELVGERIRLLKTMLGVK